LPVLSSTRNPESATRNLVAGKCPDKPAPPLLHAAPGALAAHLCANRRKGRENRLRVVSQKRPDKPPGAHFGCKGRGFRHSRAPLAIENQTSANPRTWLK